MSILVRQKNEILYPLPHIYRTTHDSVRSVIFVCDRQEFRFHRCLRLINPSPTYLSRINARASSKTILMITINTHILRHQPPSPSLLPSDTSSPETSNSTLLETGKGPQLPPSSARNTGNTPPPNVLVLISPAGPGALRRPGPHDRANALSIAVPAAVTIARPRHWCGPHPWWMYAPSGRLRRISVGSGNRTGSRPAAAKSAKRPAPSGRKSGVVRPPSLRGVLSAAATRRTPAAAGNSRKLCGGQRQ